ncbi:MAG: mandelate racemase/muconate lactonizing enzyme family protein [Thermomicrobiales bacterium]|nr:mandelate racemase/muconate lactonizing enzyme family protein [Thermomicrobiales bacterium]
MKITDLRCAELGNHLMLRVCTDDGVDGYSQVESSKPYLKDPILRLRDLIVGKDPTDVERVMRGIRQRGAAKPWGSPVSAIEMALWDIAGKAAGLPVYKLLGGKVRDRVMVYNGAIRDLEHDYTPEGFAAAGAWMRSLPHGFKFVKMAIAYHGDMKKVPGFLMGDLLDEMVHGWPVAGTISERGIAHVVECVAAMREALGPEIGIALDCGPGFSVPDAIRLARALEPLNPMWMEDLLTGDYTPWPGADLYREITTQTTIPIHTGEQLYLRQSFKELIEGKAVNIVGPDPCDVGGLAELKWIAEYADLHGILMAPHGTGDGLFGLAALVQVSATLPGNFIAFELPTGNPPWWFDIVEGLPDPLVVDGFIDVWDRPGIGIEFRVDRAREYLADEDRGFFDN